jgi:hypothetical protein
MVADRLIKALQGLNFNKFIKQLGIINVMKKLDIHKQHKLRNTIYKEQLNLLDEEDQE